MSPTRDGLKWAASVAEHVKDKFRVAATIEKSRHVKVTFSDGDSTFLWIVASTPSDVRGLKNSLSTLRQGLRQTFGIESIRTLSEFPLRLFVTTELYEAELEKEWDEFFDSLLHADGETK